MKFIKQNSHHLAMLLAMTTGAHQAHAFSVDNSQQRITVQPTYVQPAQVITSQSVYVEPTAQVTTTTNVSVQAVPQAPQEHVVSQEGYAQTQLNIPTTSHLKHQNPNNRLHHHLKRPNSHLK